MTNETFNDISLDSFDLENWIPSKDVRDSVAIQMGVEELTARQWTALRKAKGLEATNIKGIWHVRYTREDDVDDAETNVTTEYVTEGSPAVKPNVVSFGDFSSSLAVVNNVSANDIQVHNTTFNTGALASEADTFVSQLGAFTEFLANTETMLQRREQELKEQTRIKSEALNNTRLQVENIRQRALLAQRNNIAARVMNEALDTDMVEAITEGKQLHTILSGLSE